MAASNLFVITFDSNYINQINQLFYSNFFVSDRNYLMKAYKLKTEFQKNNLDQSELMLLDTLYDEIFNCGKNLALLKICDPAVNFIYRIFYCFIFQFLLLYFSYSIFFALIEFFIPN